MARALIMLEDGALIFTPQATEGITYAHKIDKAKRGSIGQNQRRICTISSGVSRQLRARSSKRSLARELSASKFYARRSQKTQGTRRVLDAHLTIGCGQGALRLLEVQRPGKAPMPAADFLRGVRLGEEPCLPRKPMPRFKLTLEYDGAPFVGWQRQTNGLSVQEVIETALEALCGERVRIRGAGRTDTGVHALGRSRTRSFQGLAGRLCCATA